MKKISICLFLILPLSGLLFQNLVAQNVPFDQKLFNQWVDMRAGTGEPVFWYCYGEVYSYPDGKLLSRMEGVDVARRINAGKDSVIQLNRKIFIYTDAKTNEALKTFNGQKVSPIAYPYQQITYVLKGDKMCTYVQQGKMPRITKFGPSYGMIMRKMGNSMVVTAPLFLNFEGPAGKIEAYENYDFYMMPDSKLENKYQLSWLRYGDLPPFLGGGKGIIQLVSYRTNSFEKLSEPLKKYIKEEAPLWLNPPKDLQEIAELQKQN